MVVHPLLVSLTIIAISFFTNETLILLLRERMDMGDSLGPLLPDCRVSSSMKDRKNDQAFLSDTKEN
jgi:hypothetical protein